MTRLYSFALIPLLAIALAAFPAVARAQQQPPTVTDESIAPPPPPAAGATGSATRGTGTRRVGTDSADRADDDDDASFRPLEPDYTLINLPTTLPLPLHKGNFRLTHRFNGNLRSGTSAIRPAICSASTRARRSASSIDSRSSSTSRSWRIARTSTARFELYGKYDALHEGTASSPLGLSAIVSVEGTNNFRQEYAPTIGASISRSVAGVAEVYAVPMWMHNVAAATGVMRDTGIIGVGGSVRVRPALYLTAESLAAPGRLRDRRRGVRLRPPDARRRPCVRSHVYERTGHHLRADCTRWQPGQPLFRIQPRTQVLLTLEQGAHTMKRASLALALALFAAGCGSSSTAPSTPSNPTFTAQMLPANEVPAITNAESTASGTATITFVPTKDASGTVTSVTAQATVVLQGFPAGTTVTLSHIHTGAAGVPGGVLIGFPPGTVTLTNGAGTYTASASGPAPTADTFASVSNNPSGFYFNVHTALNPGGVMRGQLVKQ